MKKWGIIFLFLLFQYLVNGQCAGTQSYTLTPAGPYSPGQTVTVNYTLNSFIQLNSNWIIGFDLNLGVGWASASALSAPGNPGGSSGSWIWDNQNTYPSGLNFGPGYRFQNTGPANWGTASTGPFNLSFQLTVGPSCNPQDLSISLGVIGDCQTGGWSNGACCPVSYYSIYSGTSLGSGNVSLTNTNTDIDCFGANNGSINLNISGGATPYTINWSNGSSTQNITNLSSGTYSVTVTDDLGCISTLNNLVINEPAQIQVISSTTNATCNGSLDGSASLSSPNTTITSYLWSNGQNTQTATNLLAGSYGYTITDNNGCTYSDSIYIYEPGGISSILSSTNVSCNGGNNGTISIDLIGSIAPAGNISLLNYCASSPGSSDFSNIDNVTLLGDNYNITNNTAGQCDQYEDYTATMFADITEGQSYIIDIDLGVCNNGNTTNYPSGAKVFIDWNIDGDFTDPGEEVGNIANGVAVSTSIPITAPFIGVYGATRMRVVSQFQSTVTPIGPCDVGTWAPTYTEPWFGATEDYSIVINSATITATYLWNNLATTDSVFNLSAGSYSVDITDGNGCTITDFITITEPLAISVVPTPSAITCFNGNDGGIALNISGGTPDYTISVPPYSQVLNGGVNTFATPPLLGAGTYSYTITDSSSCIYNGTVTLNNPTLLTSTTTVIACDSYVWNGSTYFSSIVQLDTLIAQNNCDSLVTLNLTITNSTSSNNNTSECDSYDWNGTTYTTSGLYDSLFTNSTGCDSTATLNLIINYSSNSLVTNTSCDSYFWGINNQTYNTSGIYTQTSFNNVGCSHNDSLILIVNNSAPSLTTTSSCNNYSWNGSNYLISGIYIDTLTTILGCDSIATLNLTITDTTSTLNTATSCDAYTWLANGQTYNSSIIDTILSINANGCPHVDSLILTVNYSNTSTDTHIVCDTFQWIDGGTYTNSNNTVTFLTTNSNGCDSLIALDLTINNSTSSFLADNSCISYQWAANNQTYINSGIYSYTTTNASGCTHTDTLNLIINTPNSGLGSINNCFFYDWNGTIYDSSGVYTDTLINIFGCDSIATLNLTISDTSHLTTKETKCISYLWPITNTVYTNSGTYIDISSNPNGCTHIDSLILVINNPSASYETVLECNFFNWNGTNYTTSGNYSITLSNTAGCDSVANLNLTISNSSSSSFSISECDSYTWEGTNYNMGGTYIKTLSTIDGCDSIVTLSLIIISGALEITTSINITDVNCFGLNNGGINLYPNGGISPLTFNWSNGANTQNISSLSSGIYNFTITDSIGCNLDSSVTINEPNELIASFQADNEICRNDSITIFIELENPKYNYYTVQFYDSIQKSFTIDSFGVLFPEGIPFYIIPSFSNQVQLISITDNNGCSSIINQSLDIIVNQLPVLELNQTDLCEGSQSFILDNASPPGGEYSINEESTNFFDAENLKIGAYTISYNYTDIITNCSNSIEEIININPLPIANFSFTPQPANIDDPNILFINNSTDIENNKWDLGDGTILANELNFWHTYADTGKYEIIYVVNNQFNCIDSLTATLTINPVHQIFTPNSFTPNNDGNNDTFQPYINGGKNYTITIFNQWGEIIFQEENGIWDGKMNGHIVQEGIYPYSILAIDFKDKPFIYTGTITLVR